MSQSPSKSSQRGIKPGDTQVVVQWSSDDMRGLFPFKRISAESRAEQACGDICFVDGNDIGSGTFNLYLYTADVPETVRRMAALEMAGRLPAGMRIGYAKYTRADRSDWVYEPAYPSDLKNFDITYPGVPRGL